MGFVLHSTTLFDRNSMYIYKNVPRYWFLYRGQRLPFVLEPHMYISYCKVFYSESVLEISILGRSKHMEWVRPILSNGLWYTEPSLAPLQDEAPPHLMFQTPGRDGAGAPPHARGGEGVGRRRGFGKKNSFFIEFKIVCHFRLRHRLRPQKVPYKSDFT